MSIKIVTEDGHLLLKNSNKMKAFLMQTEGKFKALRTESAIDALCFMSFEKDSKCGKTLGLAVIGGLSNLSCRSALEHVPPLREISLYSDRGSNWQ